jgi:hypothetical protein
MAKAKPAQPAKVGRPVEPVPPAMSEALLDHMATGGSIEAFCSQEGHPCKATVYRWAWKDEEFLRRLLRARAFGAHALVDLAQEVADDGTNDYVERETKKGTIITLDGEHVQRSKLRVDTLLRRAGFYNSTLYGTKQHLEHSGGVSVQVVTGVPADEPRP